MKGRTYKPFGGGKKKALIERAALASGKRTEDYRFKSRYGGDLGVEAFISQEMSTLAVEHASRLQEVEGDKWKDRTTSLLAQPLSAEDLFVSSDRGNPSLVLGGTRFYHDELSNVSQDDQGNLQAPSVDRFPYSSDANYASKKLANKLAKNLARRHYAAAMLQRNYRIMISLRNFRKEVVEAHSASRKIQWFWKKRLERTRMRRQEKDLVVTCCIKIQRQMRRVLAGMHVQYKRNQIVRYQALVITRFIRFSGKELKRKRGRKTRGNVHATRIQALARGVAAREYVRRMKRGMKLILRKYREWWQRKRGTRGRKIMHYLRRSILAKKIVKCQRILRGFIGKRRLDKERLQLRAYERQRKHAEQVAVERAIKNAALSSTGKGDFSWVQANGGGNTSPQSSPTKAKGGGQKGLSSPTTSSSPPGGGNNKNSLAKGGESLPLPDLKYSGNEVRGTDVVDFMEVIDLMGAQILHDVRQSTGVSKGSVAKRCIECIDPDLALNDLPMKRRISLAVLAAFSNHPGGMIHWTALRQCKPFLNPSHRAAFVKEDSERKEREMEKAEAQRVQREQRELEEEENKKAKKYKKKKDKRLKWEERKRADELDTHPVSSIGAKRSEGNQTEDETSQQEVAEGEKMERQNDDCGDDEEEEIAMEKIDRHNDGGNDEEKESAGENTKRERHPHAAWVERHHQQLDIKLDEDIWEKLEAAGPLVSILEASRWLEPSLSLRCRVTVQGHLPDKVLAHAVIVRRWTHWVENTVKRAIWRSRLNLPVPKRACPFCLESLTTPAAERDHYPCPNHQWAGSFVRNDTFLPALKCLESRLTNLTAFPTLKRSRAEKDVMAIFFKLKARNDEAYRAFKVVGPKDVDDDQQERLAQINARRFIDLAQDAVKTRDEEEQAEALIRGDLDISALSSPATTVSTGARSRSPGKQGGIPAVNTPEGKTSSAPSKAVLGPPARSPPTPPAAPKGSEYIAFVQEFYPKTTQLFQQFHHEETLRRAELDLAAAATDQASPTSSSPFGTPPKKGTTLVFSKSGDFLGDATDSDVEDDGLGLTSPLSSSPEQGDPSNNNKKDKKSKKSKKSKKMGAE